MDSGDQRPRDTDDHSPFFSQPLSSIGWGMDPDQHESQSLRQAFEPYSVGLNLDSSPLVTASSQPSGSNPKIAIPKLVSAKEEKQKSRVRRACESCRARKVKCSGEIPTCSHCTINGLRCLYKDPKQIRDRKTLERLSQKSKEYEALLVELQQTLPSKLKKRVKDVLNDSLNNGSTPTDDTDRGSSHDSYAEPALSDDSSVGSFEGMDVAQEDLNRDSDAAAMGFFGKGSDVAWMQRLDERISSADPASETTMDFLPAGREHYRPSGPSTPVKELNYHLDDQELPLQEPAQLYTLPPRHLATFYYNAYLKTLHSSFMIIREPVFTAQLEQLYEQRSKPPRTWLAVLNLVLALGCRYTHTWTGNNILQEQELFNRARKLSLSGDVLFEHADLQQVQVEALTAVYLIDSGHINRASRFSSIALQSALVLGINLRSGDSSLDPLSKETRYRLWWALTCIENTITSNTGRVSGLNENTSSVSLPNPFGPEAGTLEGLSPSTDPTTESRLLPSILQTHDQAKETARWLRKCAPSQSLFFHCIADIVSIHQSFLSRVYSLEGLREHSALLKQRTQKYSALLDTWLSKLPEVYRFTDTNGNFRLNGTKDDCEPDRVKLAINYFSLRITFCRPCLTSPSQQPKEEPSKEEDIKRGYRESLSAQCLLAACNLIRVLPEEPDLEWLATHTPRWSIIHYLMQAITALLLGLFLSPPGSRNHSSPVALSPGSAEKPDLRVGSIVIQLQKAIAWLHCLGSTDPSAARAFNFCDKCITRMAPTLNFDVTSP